MNPVVVPMVAGLGTQEIVLILIVLVPFLGGLALLVMTILPSNPAGQRFDQPSGY